MDMTRLETLETHVVTLVEAYARIQEENRQLCQEVRQLRETVGLQQEQVARLRSEQAARERLCTVLRTLSQERDIIRQKLEDMLDIIASLEGGGRHVGEAAEP